MLSHIPQGSVLDLILLIMYINDIDDCSSSNISNFTDDTKILNRVSSIEDHERLQTN